MDFSLFVHMERVDTETPHAQLWAQMLELCQMADRAGMRAIWTGEHHAMDFTISPNPFIALAYLAAVTKHVRLGTGTVIAPFWHPIKLAGEAAMADLITNGRLELGVARGAYNFEYERIMPGLDAWDAGQRMRETTPLLRQLWQGDCAHQGQYYSFPATTSAPKPVQAGGPPIWIAARDPNSHEFAVKNGFNVQVTPLWQGVAEAENLMAKFKAACAAHPGPRPKIMLLHHCYVAADEEDAQRAAREYSRYYGYFGAWFQNKRPIQQGLIAPLTEAEIAANPLYAPEALRRDLTIGTAPQVIERLKQYQAMGYDEFSLWIDSLQSHERKSASLSRFIRDVMPAFS